MQKCKMQRLSFFTASLQDCFCTQAPHNHSMFNERRAARRQDSSDAAKPAEPERRQPPSHPAARPGSRTGYDNQQRQYQSPRHQSYNQQPSSGDYRDSNKRHHPDSRSSYGQSAPCGGQSSRRGEHGGGGYGRGSYRGNSRGNDRNRGRGRNDHVPVVPLESLRLTNSGWDKVPAKLAGISARVAKSYGVFTENESFLDTLTDKNIQRLTMQQSNLSKQKQQKRNQQRVIGLNDSRVSKRIIMKNIDFEKTAPQTIHKFFESFLSSTVIPNVSYEDQSLTTVVEGNTLIIECTSSLVATTIMSFNDKYNSDMDLTFTIERPGDYIEYAKPQDEDNENGVDIIEEIVETSALCCVNNLPNDITNSQFKETLQKYGTIHSAVLLLDKLTYNCCDVAYFSFKNDTSKPIDEMLTEISKNEKWDCFLICKNTQNGYFQNVDFVRNMLVDHVDAKSPNIARHKITCTIQLLNSISLDDIMVEEKAKIVSETFHGELSQLPGFKRLKLVRPAEGFQVYQVEDIQPEYCRIFVNFESPKDAKLCLSKICGRYFHGRLILGGYVDDGDYNSIFD